MKEQIITYKKGNRVVNNDAYADMTRHNLLGKSSDQIMWKV